jgi:hypothetical protein
VRETAALRVLSAAATSLKKMGGFGPALAVDRSDARDSPWWKENEMAYHQISEGDQFVRERGAARETESS